MAYKLFVTDLDGTLLNSQLQISPGNLAALAKLVQAGVPVTVFTGRNYNSAIDFVKTIGVGIPVVFQNGALVMDPHSKREYRRIGLTGSIAFEIATEAKKFGFDVIVYSDFFALKDMQMERDVWQGHPFKTYVENNRWRTDIVGDVLDSLSERQEVVQLAVIGNMENLEAFQKRIQTRFPGQISAVISSVRGSYGFLEFFGPKVSKGEAFTFLLNHFGVTADQTVFIGDSFNDVELMRLVDMPVAVGNAPQSIKDICRLVVADHDSSGVAEAIEKLFFP
jgi:Cof subfamily protein (haloacid dehalogenase superfamily)